MRLALLALAVLLMPTGAEAGTYCARSVRDCSSNWPHCVRRCVHWAEQHRYRLPDGESYSYLPRDIELERRAERRDCRDIRRTVGDQHLTLEGAKKAANDAWS